MEGMPAALGAARAQSSTGFLRLDPEAITLPPERVARAEATAEALVPSVREHGILQPILVRRRSEGGYEVVAGARRLLAARRAGVAEIPAVVVQVSDEESEKLSAIENSCREPLAGGAAITPPVSSDAPAGVESSDQADLFAAAPVEPQAAVTPPAPVETSAPVPVAPPVAAPPRATVVVGTTVPFEVEKPLRWTPGRIVLTLVSGLVLIVIGALLGGRWQPRAAEPRPVVVEPPPAAPIVVTQVVESIRTVEVRPAVRAVDGAEIAALGWEGLRVESLSNGVVRVVVGRPLFRARAVLDSEDALKALGAIFQRHADDWRVAVVGHTDAVPFTGAGTVRDNRELGLARATEVVRFLMREAGVPAAMLQAETAGENDPPFPGDDETARRKNRTATFRIHAR
jgi:flagellar motor protein MotB